MKRKQWFTQKTPPTTMGFDHLVFDGSERYLAWVGTEEDALLIAAAPKLLDTAIMAIEHYDAYFEGSEPPEDLPWVPVMREAIKEALGEDAP